MNRALDAVVVAAAVVWWLPTIAAGFILAAPHVVALYGIRYRVRRVRRLCRRLQVDEAERVAAALERDAKAVQRWRTGPRP